ncbi:M50 family metallopeptidase [Blastopirellula marina]|uniref:Peptidase M50 n=1 Tax=Blastopirellula marina TaxID=124 RepID=A0A2S8GLH1_9BACT|nr:M50 family metallopeptidase [Blastopirellula marina]PQO45283.1 hypothetical protein C5Y93_15110 [Blastopirellula marina]
MPRLAPILFALSILGLSWLGMMAVHELGHVLAATASGGTVERVVLHPLDISRTDVSPNPRPTIVVWGGPLVGVLLPLLGWLAIPARFPWPRGLAQFFAGFCLIANGAYIGLGSLAKIGDCGEMLRHGTPIGLLWLFGAVTMPAGFWLWHRLGDAGKLFAPGVISMRGALIATACLAAVVAVEVLL